MLSNSLKNCGRDMILSLSPGPALLEKSELYKATANMWRITDDFWDDWKLLYNMFERAEKWSIHTGYNHWPDADMLPIGAIRQCYDEKNRTNFTKDELITMMSLWCMMRSPLMIGGELTKMDDFDMSLLTNEGLLNMFMNVRHSHQVFRREINGKEHVAWIGVDEKGTKYIGLFNLSDEESNVTVPFKEFEIYDPMKGYEIWTQNVVRYDLNIVDTIPAHGARVYVIDRWE